MRQTIRGPCASVAGPLWLIDRALCEYADDNLDERKHGAVRKESRLAAELLSEGNTETLALTERVRAMLVELFRDELQAGADVFGGCARSWDGRFGL